MTNLAITTQLNNKDHENHNRNSFCIFIKMVGMQQEFNIVYLQFVETRLYPLHSYVSSIILIPYSC